MLVHASVTGCNQTAVVSLAGLRSPCDLDTYGKERDRRRPAGPAPDHARTSSEQALLDPQNVIRLHQVGCVQRNCPFLAAGVVAPSGDDTAL